MKRCSGNLYGFSGQMVFKVSSNQVFLSK
uniref:Uncharacterized protein n=1 Tax=Anguilla anguilla TaxID=7936 RepID=A0A0E9UCZ5_ANGAN